MRALEGWSSHECGFLFVIGLVEDRDAGGESGSWTFEGDAALGFFAEAEDFGALDGAGSDGPDGIGGPVAIEELVPDAVVDTHGQIGEVGPVEIGGEPLFGGDGQFVGSGRVSEDMEDGPGEGLGVADEAEGSGFVVEDDFGETACVAGHDGGAGGHAFQGDDAEGFVEAGEDGDIGDAVELVEGAVGEESGEEDFVFEAGPFDEPFKFFAMASAHDHELGFRFLGEDDVGRVEEDMDAFFADEAADEHDDFLVGEGKFGADFGALLFVPIEIEFLGVDAVVDDIDFVSGGVEAADDLVLHELGADDDAPGFIGEPVLLLVDVFGGVVEDASVAAGFGRVNGGHDWEFVFVFQFACGI